MTDLIEAPGHYHAADGLQYFQVLEAYGLDRDAYLAAAVKYLIRAGRKPGSVVAEDLGKARAYLRRRVDRGPLGPRPDGGVLADARLLPLDVMRRFAVDPAAELALVGVLLAVMTGRADELAATLADLSRRIEVRP